MSGTLDTEYCSTVRWDVTDVGYRDIQSPKFRFGISEYYVTCGSGFPSSNIVLTLHLKSCQGNPTVPSKATVQVESRGQILPSLTHYSEPRISTGAVLWRKSIPDIKEADAGFNKHLWLTFVMTFKSKLFNTTNTVEKSVQTSLCINPIPSYKSLYEDLAKLLNESPDPDVEFRCGGQSIKAHRLVLQARSPVIARMLQSKMVEGQTGVIVIEDMSPSILKCFLHYLYTGRLDGTRTYEETMALYDSADKYEVKSLARWCAQTLVEGVTVQNACGVLELADAHSDEEFVEAIVTFMLEKKVPMVSESWPDFCSSHPKLAFEIYGRLTKMHISI